MPKQFRTYVEDYGGLKVIKSSKNPDKLYWGLPAVFTEEQLDKFFLSDAVKKRLSSLKEGTVLRLGKISSNSWHCIMVDKTFNQGKIDVLEVELKQINAEIKALVGDKMKRANEIREELKGLY